MSAQPLQPLAGYHHMTMVTRDAPANARFYRETLRLRLVKKTVNFDMPYTYHLYYGDSTGSPGTLLTFFEWPNAEPGRRGWGGTHHLALSVASGAALAWWRGHLEREGVDVQGPFDDHGYPTIRFSDPDGLLLELSAPAGEDVPDGAPALWAEGLAIGALHHVNVQVTNRETAIIYYRDLLGFELTGEGTNPDHPLLTDLLFTLATNGDEPTMRLIVTLVDRAQTEHAAEGPGQTHHIAFAALDDAVELDWQERLASAGIPVSEVRDRNYFHTIYFNDPDGHLLEIATNNPGFAVDEPPDSLGQRLMLPPQYEARREQLERTLKPLD
jgi:glyoxalase family protein